MCFLTLLRATHVNISAIALLPLYFIRHYYHYDLTRPHTFFPFFNVAKLLKQTAAACAHATHDLATRKEFRRLHYLFSLPSSGTPPCFLSFIILLVRGFRAAPE